MRVLLLTIAVLTAHLASADEPIMVDPHDFTRTPCEYKKRGCSAYSTQRSESTDSAVLNSGRITFDKSTTELSSESVTDVDSVAPRPANWREQLEAEPKDDSWAYYMERPLKLPQIEPGTACPVSVGANDVVSSAHGYIFGAGGFFFGTGPVYIALAWKPRDRPEGFFDLDRVPTVPEGYRLKTPWIMHPAYDGEALVRGAQIGTAAIREILFNGEPHFQPTLILRSADRPETNSYLEDGKIDAVWGWWPTSMVLPEPGCFAIQIDTETNSDIVVFEATPPE